MSDKPMQFAEHQSDTKTNTTIIIHLFNTQKHIFIITNNQKRTSN